MQARGIDGLDEPCQHFCLGASLQKPAAIILEEFSPKTLNLSPVPTELVAYHSRAKN